MAMATLSVTCCLLRKLVLVFGVVFPVVEGSHGDDGRQQKTYEINQIYRETPCHIMFCGANAGADDSLRAQCVSNVVHGKVTAIVS